MKLRTLVMKFGGASLATPSHFCRVASCIKKKLQSYDQLVVVVSAMGRMTDELIGLAREVSFHPLKREQDMLISVGERISMTLLAMALADKGVKAVSLTGSQSGIITSDCHLNALIKEIRPERLLQHLKEGKIVIVAGFQGVSESKEITTLGRGGSDTTAVALGVAIRAHRVEFYKDVRGFYQRDPKRFPSSPLFQTLTFQKAISLAKKGSSPIHLRSILLALKNGLPLHIMSFKVEEFGPYSGTLITGGSDQEGGKPVYELSMSDDDDKTREI